MQLTDRLIGFLAKSACQFVATLQARGHRGISVSLNLSPAEFAVVSPAAIIAGEAARLGVATSELEIEITEKTLFDSERFADKIDAFRRLGFSLAIDDFGSGHSSIAQLMAVDFDTIKIDRTFVHDLHKSPKNQALVAAVVAIGQASRHRIVAEGIECEDEAEMLRYLGCSNGQGWLFSPAMNFSDALAWMKNEADPIGNLAG